MSDVPFTGDRLMFALLRLYADDVLDQRERLRMPVRDGQLYISLSRAPLPATGDEHYNDLATWGVPPGWLLEDLPAPDPAGELDPDLVTAWDYEARGATDAEVLRMARKAVPRLAAEVERLRRAADAVDYAEVRARLDAEALALELRRIADGAGVEVTGEAADIIDMYLPAEVRSHLGAFERGLDLTDADLRDVRHDMGEGMGGDLER